MIDFKRRFSRCVLLLNSSRLNLFLDAVNNMIGGFEEDFSTPTLSCAMELVCLIWGYHRCGTFIFLASFDYVPLISFLHKSNKSQKKLNNSLLLAFENFAIIP